MKLKRIIAAAATFVFASAAVLGNPMVTSAEEAVTYYWYEEAAGEFTDIPVICSEPIKYDYYIRYADFPHDLVAYPDAFSDWDEEEIEYHKDKLVMWFNAGFYDNFNEGDVVTVQLPFSYPIVAYNWDTDYWDMTIDGNTASLTCVDYNCFIYFRVFMSLAKQSQDNFWFEPMNLELAIAAEEALANGTGVAKTSGDFALSYDIMKWLDAHPGVTLEYTLTYKDAEHLIVIPGGGNCANPSIPWYGPEYLIGLYESR